MAGGTTAFHPNDFSKASLGRHSKSNTKTKGKNLWGRDKPVSLLKRTGVTKQPFRAGKCCANGPDNADFLIDGLNNIALRACLS
jgi:hypothetical protein